MSFRRATGRGSRRAYPRASSGGAVTTTAVTPSTATQWDDTTAITVDGTNFTPASVVSLDGTALVTVYVGAAQLTATIPSSYTSALLRTSGAKAVTVDGSATSATLTVSAWTYTTPSGCALLLDADAANITISTGVSQWSDTSGNARHFTQGTGANQPAHVASLAALNNRPAVNGDGLNDSLVNASALSAIASASAFEWFVVGVVDAYNSNDANPYINAMWFGETAGYAGIHTRTTGTLIQCYNFDGSIDANQHAAAAGAGQLVSYRHSGGNIVSSLNGGAETTAASGNTTVLTGTLALFKGFGASYADAHIALVVAYSGALSAADRGRAQRKARVFYGL